MSIYHNQIVNQNQIPFEISRRSCSFSHDIVQPTAPQTSFSSTACVSWIVPRPAHCAMSSRDGGHAARLKAMGKELYQVQGVDRLKLWLEYTHLQDEDPKAQVNQCEPFSRVRAIYANPWLHQDWMTSCVPFLKLHSWSLDDPKHPRVVFNVRKNLPHSDMRRCLLSCP